uniref:Uncharacterized protein n=1 Tax=Corethron hystrix TaxID=216773 RepID=A0A7S1FWP5_9STRA
MVALSPSTIVGEEIIHIHDQTGSTGVQGEEPIFVPRKSSGAEPVFNASSSIPSLQSNPNPSNRPSMLSSTMDLLSSVSKKNLPYQIFPTIHKFFFQFNRNAVFMPG